MRNAVLSVFAPSGNSLMYHLPAALNASAMMTCAPYWNISVSREKMFSSLALAKIRHLSPVALSMITPFSSSKVNSNSDPEITDWFVNVFMLFRVGKSDTLTRELLEDHGGDKVIEPFNRGEKLVYKRPYFFSSVNVKRHLHTFSFLKLNPFSVS